MSQATWCSTIRFILTNEPPLRIEFPGVLAPMDLCFVQRPGQYLDGRAFWHCYPADLRIAKRYSRGSCNRRPYAHGFFAHCIEIREFIE
jgi:hypothetical protein